MEIALIRAALLTPLRSRVVAALRPLATASATRPTLMRRRQFHIIPRVSASNSNQFGMPGSPMPSYFAAPRAPSLPSSASVIRFVPQQTAWVVERMGKFSRILPPGLAILIPFIDRIAYVKSLKEATFDIPSQSAITADNVTLELDGVLYTRVFDAYKAR